MATNPSLKPKGDFVRRRHRHGVNEAQIDTLLVNNPRSVFSAAHRRLALGGSDA